MSSKNIISLDFQTDMRLAFLAALMRVSKDECVTFLINKTIESLIPELKKGLTFLEDYEV